MHKLYTTVSKFFSNLDDDLKSSVTRLRTITGGSVDAASTVPKTTKDPDPQSVPRVYCPDATFGLDLYFAPEANLK